MSEMNQQLARLLAGADPHTLPDDPVINKRLETLAKKERQASMYRAVLPAMVYMSDSGVPDNRIFKVLGPMLEQWLGYSPSQAKNFWKTIKREHPEIIEQIRNELNE